MSKEKELGKKELLEKLFRWMADSQNTADLYEAKMADKLKDLPDVIAYNQIKSIIKQHFASVHTTFGGGTKVQTQAKPKVSREEIKEWGKEVGNMLLTTGTGMAILCVEVERFLKKKGVEISE